MKQKEEHNYEKINSTFYDGSRFRFHVNGMRCF